MNPKEALRLAERPGIRPGPKLAAKLARPPGPRTVLPSLGRPRNPADTEAGYHLLLWPTFRDFLRRRTVDADVAAFRRLSGDMQRAYFHRLAGLASADEAAEVAFVLASAGEDFAVRRPETCLMLRAACDRISASLTAKALPILRRRVQELTNAQRRETARTKTSGSRDLWRAAVGRYEGTLSVRARDMKRDAPRWAAEIAALRSSRGRKPTSHNRCVGV